MATKEISPVPSFFFNTTTAYIFKRLGQGAFVIFLVSLLSFFLLKLSPGDCLSDLRFDPSITKEFIESEEIRLGYDKPVYMQYFIWLSSALRGNLGQTCQGSIPVLSLVGARAGTTLMLSFATIVITWAIAIPVGIFAAVKQNTWGDRLVQVISYFFQGFPSFVLAILLLMLAQNTSLFPVGGLTSIDFSDLSWFGKVVDIGYHLFLPVLTLTIISFAGLQRLMRGNLLDVMRQDYIKTARAKGLPENKVIYVHALRNAFNPMVTLLGYEFGALLSGSFITEFFFSIPGLGRLLLEAVFQRDVSLVMAGLMIGTFMLVIGNIFADLMLKLLDPRIKLEEMD
ncbi:ABC-type transporter, integral membrane subunit [Thalassoporum mexicanum PCC 7367]|uniref:ABC transporter permease n=1 Tax=Thalassoporum mexicanum TaxID=3457544 RepID=UPI00029FB614|nr:ABC transporter permease [Pseudanabaena sp. PCC 7367]AFY69315.1 ABC-type transporter, integral membrane subunit [Pseudanabaena sp. PCC 7367]